MTPEDRITEVLLFFLLALTFAIGLGLTGAAISILTQADALIENVVGIFLLILGTFMLGFPIYSVWQFVVITGDRDE